MLYTATITKTADAQKMGEYAPTAIDALKASADIRIVAVDSTYTVISRLPLKGRGIKAPYSNPLTYEVTEAAMTKLQNTYRVAADF